MSMNIRSLAAIALASVLLLTACTADQAPTASSSPSGSAAATASPTPTTEADPLEGVNSGDPIDAELAATINASWLGYTDDKAYAMPDGSFVLVKGGEPLPENVKAAIASVLTPLSAAIGRRGDYVAEAAGALRDARIALRDARIAQEEASGRHVTYVTHAWHAMPSGGFGQAGRRMPRR